MRVGFYAPLKSPTHRVPSGDRRMAQLIMAALGASGHDVTLLSRLRSYDAGDRTRQEHLARRGACIAALLGDRLAAAPPRAILTYHLYHKAPDWIGPVLARRFAVPYVVIEASVADKRARGAWAMGYQASLAALAQARAVVSLNPADVAGVAAHVGADCVMINLAPFLDHLPYVAPPRAPRGEARLLAVAMMRPGDKLASYRVLAEALGRIEDRPWRLTIAGYGPARDEVAAAFARFGSRIDIVGALESAELARLYAACDIFVWPAVNEAFGMALLEAQAAGLPAVVGNAGAIATIVADGATGWLSPMGDARAFADHLATLIDDPVRRVAMGQAAAAKIAREHGLAAAGRTLDALLRRLAP